MALFLLINKSRYRIIKPVQNILFISFSLRKVKFLKKQFPRKCDAEEGGKMTKNEIMDAMRKHARENAPKGGVFETGEEILQYFTDEFISVLREAGIVTVFSEEKKAEGDIVYVFRDEPHYSPVMEYWVRGWLVKKHEDVEGPVYCGDKNHPNIFGMYQDNGRWYHYTEEVIR